MHRVQLFRHYGVTPLIVFDGGYLPSKASTETERLARREASKKKAMDLWHAERRKEALDQFRKCVDVTPEMAFAVMQALQAARVEYVVAPYEADAQLAYLEKTGKVQGIVTEDSDLLVFGCKRMIFKLDQYGSGIEIRHEHLSRVRELSFHNWTMTEIRHMCILSGCDYLPSIPGMGLKTAHRMLRRHKTYGRVIKDVRMENTSVRVPTNYEQLFEQADMTFLYARVYDMDKKCLVHLNEVPDDLKDILATSEYDFLGPLLSPEVAHGIATGRLNPITKEPLTLPNNARQLQLPKSLLSTGKENKMLYHAPRPPVPASTKSIQSYFTKPSARHPSSEQSLTSAGSLSESILRKREQSVLFEESIQLKRQCSNEKASAAALDSSSVTPTKVLHGSTTKHSHVVVESKSRFFGFDVHEEDEEFANGVVPESLLKARRSMSANREDSGVGLDELELQQHSSLSFEALRYSAKFTHTSTEHGVKKLVYCEDSDAADEGEPSAENEEYSEQEGGDETVPSQRTGTQLSTQVTGEALDEESTTRGSVSNTSSKSTVEDSIVKGWRERFSNPTAPERSSGLTKAFEKMRESSVATSSSSSSKQGMGQRRTASSFKFNLTSSSASSLSSATNISPPSSQSSEPGTGSATRRGRGRPPLTYRLSGSGGGGGGKRAAPIVHVHAHDAKYHLSHPSGRLPLMPKTNLPQVTVNTNSSATGEGNKLSKPIVTAAGKTGSTPGASLQQMLQLDRFKYTPASSSLS
ncbi:Rad2 nuclease [Actinomortierella ambigua]|nr:Rad2 nuclease [Actinomortierella ambigua]